MLHIETVDVNTLDLMSFYGRKFVDGSPFTVLKSLVYFSDAEEDPMPNMLIPFDWTVAQKQITATVTAFCTDR